MSLPISPLFSSRTHGTCKMAPGDMTTHTSLDFIALAHRSFQLGRHLRTFVPQDLFVFCTHFCLLEGPSPGLSFLSTWFQVTNTFLRIPSLCCSHAASLELVYPQTFLISQEIQETEASSRLTTRTGTSEQLRKNEVM